MKNIIQKTMVLDEAAIDDFSFELQQTLKKRGCKKKEILNARLIVEDVLFQWLQRGLRGGTVEVDVLKTLRKYVVNLTVPGQEINPLMEENDDMSGAELQGFLLNATKDVNYLYRSGANILTLRISGQRINHFFWIFLAIISACLCGAFFHAYLPGQIEYVVKGYVTPTFESLLGLLTAIVAPYVFFFARVRYHYHGQPKTAASGWQTGHVYLMGSPGCGHHFCGRNGGPGRSFFRNGACPGFRFFPVSLDDAAAFCADEYCFGLC